MEGEVSTGILLFQPMMAQSGMQPMMAQPAMTQPMVPGGPHPSVFQGILMLLSLTPLS